jgi:omega-6 fatty acid desaturase (delta-12 desaturase)
VNWSRRLAAYKEPQLGRSLAELAITAGPLLALWALGLWAARAGLWWLAVPITLVASGFMLRLFLIQHDCGHGAYFKSKSANDWLGRIIAVLTLTPYAYWRDTHAIHHATSGDLDRRDLGAVETYTVAEYEALPRWHKLAYRAYRHPLVMFGIGPTYLFFIQQRFPVGLMRKGVGPWISTLGSSLFTALVAAGLIAAFGVWPVLVVCGGSILIAATIGVWLFYVQHQFEGVAWARSKTWKPQDAALHASSHYDLPGVLHWISAHIGVHHVHHLSSRIPFYRLPQVLKDHPELKAVSRVGVRESLRYPRLTLWDEAAGRLVGFSDLRERAA